MYSCITTALGEVEDRQIDTSENGRTTPQSQRPYRRHSIENVVAMNVSSVNELDNESVGAMSSDNTGGGSNVGE